MDIQLIADPTSSPVSAGKLLQACPIAAAQLREDGFVLDCNPAFRTLTGHACGLSEEHGPNWSFFDDIKEENAADLRKYLADGFSGKRMEKPCSLELIVEGRGNDTASAHTTVSLYVTSVETTDDKYAVFILLIDTTEQRNLELRFAHSQKMQAVGQ